MRSAVRRVFRREGRIRTILLTRHSEKATPTKFPFQVCDHAVRQPFVEFNPDFASNAGHRVAFWRDQNSLRTMAGIPVRSDSQQERPVDTTLAPSRTPTHGFVPFRTQSAM